MIRLEKVLYEQIFLHIYIEIKTKSRGFPKLLGFLTLTLYCLKGHLKGHLFKNKLLLYTTNSI
jgi:hypothetical protein